MIGSTSRRKWRNSGARSYAGNNDERVQKRGAHVHLWFITGEWSLDLVIRNYSMSSRWTASAYSEIDIGWRSLLERDSHHGTRRMLLLISVSRPRTFPCFSHFHTCLVSRPGGKFVTFVENHSLATISYM